MQEKKKKNDSLSFDWLEADRVQFWSTCMFWIWDYLFNYEFIPQAVDTHLPSWCWL